MSTKVNNNNIMPSTRKKVDLIKSPDCVISLTKTDLESLDQSIYWLDDSIFNTTKDVKFHLSERNTCVDADIKELNTYERNYDALTRVGIGRFSFFVNQLSFVKDEHVIIITPELHFSTEKEFEVNVIINDRLTKDAFYQD
jgi:hypothetical protein